MDKKLIIRLAAYLAGLLILAFGLTMNVMTGLGVSPIISVSYAASEITGIAFAVTAGFCFICILFPGLAGDFRGAADAQMPEMLSDALAADRRGLLVSDARKTAGFLMRLFRQFAYFIRLFRDLL